MASTHIKAFGTERIELKRPFKGFLVSITLMSDDPLPAVIQTSQIADYFDKVLFPFATGIDLNKAYITLRHVTSGVNIFKMPFFRIWAKLNELNTSTCLTSFYPAEPNEGFLEMFDPNTRMLKASFNFGLPMSTYDGEYELIFECNDAIKQGYTKNSYFSITPEWSTDVQTFIKVYNDYTLERPNTDISMGSGIVDVSILPKEFKRQFLSYMRPDDSGDVVITSSAKPIAVQDWIKPITRFAYSSKENSESYMLNEIITFSQLLQESEILMLSHDVMSTISGTANNGSITIAKRMFYPFVLMLHHGEILSDFRLSLEQTAPNPDGIVVYTKMYNNLDVAYSELKQNAILDSTIANIQNL